MLNKPNNPIILKQKNAKKPRNIKNRVVYLLMLQSLSQTEHSLWRLIPVSFSFWRSIRSVHFLRRMGYGSTSMALCIEDCFFHIHYYLVLFEQSPSYVLNYDGLLNYPLMERVLLIVELRFYFELDTLLRQSYVFKCNSVVSNLICVMLQDHVFYWVTYR